MNGLESYQRRQPDRENWKSRLNGMAIVLGVGDALRATFHAEVNGRNGPFDDLIAKLS